MSKNETGVLNPELDPDIIMLTMKDVQKLSHEHNSVELNNVLEGLEDSFYTVVMEEPPCLERYSLLYVGNSNGIKGLILNSGKEMEHRDMQTLLFARAIELEFPKQNALHVFNTFQSSLAMVYEKMGIICIPEFIAKNDGHLSVILPNPNKTGVDYIMKIDVLAWYRSYFGSDSYQADARGIPKVYLLYDQKFGHVKIGQTSGLVAERRKSAIEPTLRSTDPKVEIIVAWAAQSEFETELHKYFSHRRVRGEWFDLKSADFELINKQASTFDMIYLEDHGS